MQGIKNFFKSIALGLLYLLMSFAVYQMGCGVVSMFCDMCVSTGFIAIGNFCGVILVSLTILLFVFLMGAIPLAMIEELKENKKKEESTDDIRTS